RNGRGVIRLHVGDRQVNRWRSHSLRQRGCIARTECSQDSLMNSATTIPTSQPVQIRTAGVSINRDLCVLEKATGIVVFVHGSGSSRFSRRNRAVEEALVRAHLATLLLDLLTDAEERTDATTAEFRFDIPLLAER